MTDLQERLEKFNVNDKKVEEIEKKINQILKGFNGLIDTYADDIKDDIINTELGEKLGKELSEEDVDKMLIIYEKATASDLKNWSLTHKRNKVVKIIAEQEDACKERDLAINIRVASLKTELMNSLKTEVVKQIRSTVQTKIAEYEKPVEQKREELAQTKEYQQEQEAIKQAKADKVARDLIKQRESQRKSAYTAVAKAAVSAVQDKCVQQTRENIIAQYDNAVDLTQSLDAQLKEKDTNFNPVNNQEHYEEIEEMVLEGLRKPEYQLSQVKVGSDPVKNSGHQSQLGELEQLSAAETVHSTNGTVPQTVDAGID